MRPWVYVFLVCAVERILRTTRRQPSARKRRARGRRSVVDVTFNVEPAPATYNVTHHRGEPKEERGGALGRSPPSLLRIEN